MPDVREIPAEIEIKGIEGPTLTVEQIANFLRDLVFLHDRLWVAAFKDTREYPISSGYFYMRNKRPLPIEQQLQLVALEMHSPLLIQLGITAGIATVYFRLLRKALLLPGELRQRNWEAEKTKAEIRKIDSETKLNELKAAASASDTVSRGNFPGRQTKLKENAATVVRELRAELLDLGPHVRDSIEEIEHVVTRDVERLTEDEIVVTDVTVRRYRRVPE